MVYLSERTRTEITSADSKSIGFDYQYLFFMLMCLKMTTGEEVGYEELDDVHRVTSSGITYLFQLKHTVETNAAGCPINLSSGSKDLWKSLSNWSLLIKDEKDGRKSVVSQKNYINRTYFVFVTNKRIDNNIIDELEQYKCDRCTIKEFRETLIKQRNAITDTTIKAYIENVLSLNNSVLSLFLRHLEFLSSTSDLIAEIKDSIREKMVSDAYVDDVLNELYAQLKREFFQNVQTRQHQRITFAEWHQRYKSVFSKYANTMLPIREYVPTLPADLRGQAFVHELLEIGYLCGDEDDLPEIADLTSKCLDMQYQLECWCRTGEINSITVQQYHAEAIARWKNTHRKFHSDTRRDVNGDCVNALNCFYEVLKEKLCILNQNLGEALSNGEYIYLADTSRIGWRMKWRAQYYAKLDE